MKLLTEKVAHEIGGALHRIEEIAAKKVVAPGDEAERRGQEQFLQRVLVEHAHDLLACWFTMQQQYKPLILGVTSLLAHANAAMSRAAATPPTPTPQATPTKNEQS